MARHFRHHITTFFIQSGESYCEQCWRPSIDIYRGKNGWLIKCDLAGVRPEDVKLTAQDDELTISGVRRDWVVLEGQEAYSMEISYNRFERTVHLPCDLRQCDLQREFRDGMLLIKIMNRESGR